MKVEDQVCSLEQAKKLKELGVKQNESAMYWFIQKRALGMGERVSVCYYTDATYYEQYSAFTVAELGMMYGEDYYTWYNGSVWTCAKHGNFKWISGNNEAECRASMLIYLIEVKFITIDEINARI